MYICVCVIIYDLYMHIIAYMYMGVSENSSIPPIIAIIALNRENDDSLLGLGVP